MGTLKYWFAKCKNKHVFILDRNDGQMYVDELEKFKDRFVEQFRVKGQWVWIVLEIIPGDGNWRMEDNEWIKNE